MILFKHKNNTSVAVEVIKMYTPPGKNWAKIHVRWWKLTGGRPMYCMNIDQYLTDATIVGNKEARKRYPLDKWKKDWERI